MDLNLSFLQQDNIVAELQDLVELHCKDYPRDKDLSADADISNVEIIEKEISTNPRRLSEWFRLITTKTSCPLDCRIGINSITARALAKVLIWDDCQIKSLDLSNLGLSDKAGCYISRALKNNKTLVKLELNGNQLGPNTCIELAKSLTSNSTLVFLSLASNRLTKINGDCKKQKEDCIDELAQAIASNTSLTTLSLYRCGIGHEPMKAICHAVCQNSSLISVEIGYNEYGNSDVSLLNKQLEKNRRAWELVLSRGRDCKG